MIKKYSSKSNNMKTRRLKRNKVIDLTVILEFCFYNLHIVLFTLLGIVAVICAVAFDATHQYFIGALSLIIAFVSYNEKKG